MEMGQTIEAVFEKGVFRPKKPVRLKEGAEVRLTMAPRGMTEEEAEEHIRGWQKVFEGLTDEEVAEIANVRESRKSFFRQRTDEE
jgi:predicted DNA-binding antitoxin AbrB/MazE fold protein